LKCFEILKFSSCNVRKAIFVSLSFPFMLKYLCTTSLWWTCRWHMLQTCKVSMNRASGIQFSHTFLFMAPLLWWSIQESSYQVFQVNSHSDSLSTPFRCMQDTCVYTPCTGKKVGGLFISSCNFLRKKKGMFDVCN
jgi:hypothetical protein